MKCIPFFIFIILLFSVNILLAQTQVVIGDGTATGHHIPFSGYNYYSYSQTIYQQGDIGLAGDINTIYWYYSGQITRSAILDIYIGHTTQSTLTGFLPIAGFTQVFSGTLEFSAAGWYEIELNAPFTYNNTDNLVIAVNRNPFNWQWSSSMTFHTTQVAGSNRTALSRTDGSPYDPANPPASPTLLDRYPNIMLEFAIEGAPGAPTNPVPANGAVAIPTDTGLSWLNGVDTDYVQVLFGTINPPVTQVYNGAAVQSLTNALIGGELNPTTTYYWRVNPSNDDHSLTGPVWSFTTDWGDGAYQIGYGTINNTGTSYPAPYGNWYGGARHQMLIPASELHAAGMTEPLNIDSFALDVVTAQGSPLTNFTVYIGTTNVNSLTNWIGGLTEVYTTAAYSPTGGWNNHNFTNPFFWDGSSNLVIETCFANAGYSNNCIFNQTATTGYNSTIYFISDNEDPFFNPGISGTVAQRPNIVLQASDYIPLDVDLAIQSFSGPTEGMVGSNLVYTVNVINLGNLAQDNYTVRLMQEGDVVLGTIDANINLGLFDVASFDFVWTPGAEIITSLWGEVVLDGDQNLANNVSSVINVDIGPAQFAGGSGTETDPYLIATIDHLNNIRNFLGSTYTDLYFRQVADLDLGVPPYNEGNGWIPIGEEATALSFYGNYDGNDYVFENLFINRTANNTGLFGYIRSASLHNITLVDVDINGAYNTGALVGAAMDSSVISGSSAVGGTVIGTSQTGGLVGHMRLNARIDNCYTNLYVAGDFPAGGLVGATGHFDDSGDITGCYVMGHTTYSTASSANTFVGGIAGTLWNSTMADSYNTGAVTGDYAGGLAARSYVGTIINCYATGFISGGTGNYHAGLVAQTISTSPVINSYWNIETTGQTTTSGGGTGLITVEMLQQATFTDWNFTEVWQIVEGETYPFHIWQGTPGDHNYPPPLPPGNLTAQIQPGVESITLMWQAPAIGVPDAYNVYRTDGRFSLLDTVIGDTSYEDNNVQFMYTYSYYVTAVYGDVESQASNTVTSSAFSGFAGGFGTIANPYLVETAEHLFNVRFGKNMHYLQIADIDFNTEEGPWEGPNGFEPIGIGYNVAALAFSGSYDGDNYTISNLFMNQARSTVGLFGFVIGGTLKNIGLIDVDVTGGMDTGALAGYVIASSSIFDCYSTGVVHAGSHGGGLVGRFEGGSSMVNCYSDADVIMSSTPGGGLVGALYNAGVSITNSYATGNVSTTATSAWFGGYGGLVGNTGGGGVISNCFAAGSVTGPGNIGGLVGSHTQGASVSNSYAIGAVTLTGTGPAGGLIALLENSPGPTTNSYWNTQTTGQATSQGGAGRTTAEMTYPYATNTYETWDFAIIWAADTDSTVNNGYPYFRWMVDTTPPELEVPIVSIAITDDNAIISWGLIFDIDGYKVYAADYPEAADWDLVATISDNMVTSYSVPTVERIYYKVTSYINRSESEDSEIVGYTRYACLAGLNMVALPMQTTFTMAGDLGNYYSGLIDQISYWDQTAQQFITAVNLFGTWEGNFPIGTNSVLMINATSPFNLYSAGYLPAEGPSYPIVAGLNTIMVPLNRHELNWASLLAADFGQSVIDQVSYWDNINQQFITAVDILGSWEGNFAVSITQPLMVNSSQSMTWPSGTARTLLPIQPRTRSFNIRN